MINHTVKILALTLGVLRGVLSTIELYCVNETKNYQIKDTSIDVEVHDLGKYGLLSSIVPCAYNTDGKCLTTSVEASKATNEVTYACAFTMNEYIITSQGFIFNYETSHEVSFDNETMTGTTSRSRRASWITNTNTKDLIKYEKILQNSRIDVSRYDKVVAMPVINGNNQMKLVSVTLPMVGMAYTVYKSTWDKLFFHCSIHVAAILNLLGVPREHLLIKKAVVANQVLQLWIPGWVSTHSTPIKGITAEVSHLLSEALLSKKFGASSESIELPLSVSSVSHPEVSYNDLLNPSDPFRYIIYHSKPNVYDDSQNEDVILKNINSVINTYKYRLVVIRDNNANVNTIAQLHLSWQRYSPLYSKAIIVIGHSGVAVNNIMFTPTDCHVIDFATLPVRHSATKFVFNVHYAKGGSGKFFVINNENPRRLKVSNRDVLHTLIQIDKEIPEHDLLSVSIEGLFNPM